MCRSTDCVSPVFTPNEPALASSSAPAGSDGGEQKDDFAKSWLPSQHAGVETLLAACRQASWAGAPEGAKMLLEAVEALSQVVRAQGETICRLRSQETLHWLQQSQKTRAAGAAGAAANAPEWRAAVSMRDATPDRGARADAATECASAGGGSGERAGSARVGGVGQVVGGGLGGLEMLVGMPQARAEVPQTQAHQPPSAPMPMAMLMMLERQLTAERASRGEVCVCVCLRACLRVCAREHLFVHTPPPRLASDAHLGLDSMYGAGLYVCTTAQKRTGFMVYGLFYMYAPQHKRGCVRVQQPQSNISPH